MNINLELYRTFYYVALNGSISKAAEELLVSQPAVSKSIKTLEDQVGTSLFVRKKDGVVLTEVGDKLYKSVREIMELVTSTQNELENLTNMEEGTISIGASRSIIHNYLMPLIAEFHNRYPKINIKIYTDKTIELIKKTKLGLVDVFFSNMPINLPTNFDVHKIMELHDCLVANEKYLEYKDKKINKKDLEKIPLIILTQGATTRIRFDNYCKKNKLNIKPVLELGSDNLIMEFVASGFGVGLVTYEYVKEEIDKNNLFKLDFVLSMDSKYLGMIYNNDNKSFVTEKFIKFIKGNTSN